MDTAPHRPTAEAADLTRIFALMPVRSLERAKTRLALALDPEERLALAAGLTGRTLRALAGARAAGDIAAVIVASDDPAALAAAVTSGATALPVGGRDLVADLLVARERAVVDGATAVLVVPTDLARVSVATLGEVVAAASDALRPGCPLVVIVPDRAGEGTNALLVSPPRAIAFAFGPGSRGRHAAAARAAGAVLVEIDSALALDLDTPDDLAAAPEIEAVADAAAAANASDAPAHATADATADAEVPGRAASW